MQDLQTLMETLSGWAIDPDYLYDYWFYGVLRDAGAGRTVAVQSAI